ncbi:lamin tail domain-containing protein [Halosimplex carlsbadense]|uniref:lamin tail domain-containing protein n=1 Tax=Halosimplex carlsbadense TaxID=171164 RepID=UPI001377DE3D|nr:lamin tail domain-containing protein [Halosimplex carlsbadense]
MCVATICLSGCGFGSDGSQDPAQSDEDSAELRTPTIRSDSPDQNSDYTEKQPSSPIYFSEILPNPEGNDADNLDSEYYIIEVNTDTTVDLSGYEINYGEQLSFSLPATLTDVEPHTSIRVVTGKPNDGTTTPQNRTRTIFSERDSPVLSNSGMKLKLRNRDGELVDKVEYGELREGVLYVRPE